MRPTWPRRPAQPLIGRAYGPYTHWASAEGVQLYRNAAVEVVDEFVEISLANSPETSSKVPIKLGLEGCRRLSHHLLLGRWMLARSQRKLGAYR